MGLQNEQDEPDLISVQESKKQTVHGKERIPLYILSLLFFLLILFNSNGISPIHFSPLPDNTNHHQSVKRERKKEREGNEHSNEQLTHNTITRQVDGMNRKQRSTQSNLFVVVDENPSYI